MLLYQGCTTCNLFTFGRAASNKNFFFDQLNCFLSTEYSLLKSLVTMATIKLVAVAKSKYLICTDLLNLNFTYLSNTAIKIGSNCFSGFRGHLKSVNKKKIYKNSAEGVIAPAGAKVTGATIRMWLLNKFISFLAVLTWKTGLKKM